MLSTKQPAMGKTIGIDLGTSNTCAAISNGGRAHVLKSSLGYDTIPSVLTFDDDGKAVVGQAAERRMGLEPHNVIYGSKRLLGRHMLPGAKEYFQPHFAYELVSDDNDMIAAHICDRIVTFTETAALILREVRNAAEHALNDKVDRAVVTVPAYFTNAQRACVWEAGRMADLDVIRTINEPTAAAVAFGARQNVKKKVLVFDLGGGTFDVSVVSIDGDIYQVLGVGGDTFLGGLDFDRAFADSVVLKSDAIENYDLLTDLSEERIRVAVRDAKHLLSSVSEAAILLPGLQLSDGTTIDVSESVSRTDLEEATEHLIQHTLAIVARTLDELDVGTGDIHDVLLVGGQSRMPLVQERLRDMFDREPSRRVHPDEVVALGAAIAAEALTSDESIILQETLPLAIGIGHERDEFQVVVPGNSQVPCRFTANFVIPAGSVTHKLPIYQGSSLRSSENDYLGILEISELPESIKNIPGQAVFEVDDECMLRITAEVPELGIEREVELSPQLPDRDDVLVDRLPIQQVVSRTASQSRSPGKDLPSTTAGGTAAPRPWYERLLNALGFGRAP